MFKWCVALLLVAVVAAQKSDDQIWDDAEELSDEIRKFLTDILKETPIEDVSRKLTDLQNLFKNKTDSSADSTIDKSDVDMENDTTAIEQLSMKLKNKFFVLSVVSEILEDALERKDMPLSTLQLVLSVLIETVSDSLQLSSLIHDLPQGKQAVVRFTEHRETVIRYRRSLNFKNNQQRYGR